MLCRCGATIFQPLSDIEYECARSTITFSFNNFVLPFSWCFIVVVIVVDDDGGSGGDGGGEILVTGTYSSTPAEFIL